jgi:putative glycerol-1-phosphate prenyltransferase
MSGKLLCDLNASKKEGKKKLGVLIDPDKVYENDIEKSINFLSKSGIDYILVGGSLLIHDSFHETIHTIKQKSKIPIILFPSSTYQISHHANAILFLSMISGRNPELLIGKHVEAAPLLRNSGLEILPTGYMLVDGGIPTTASYISNTTPIPANKPEIAACTALAGEYLGLKLMYLDSGSGAKNPISAKMISLVSQTISVPLIVGGGIRTPESAYLAATAGADMVIIGNILEENPALLPQFVEAIKTKTHEPYTNTKI